MVPEWLRLLSIVALILGLASAGVIVIDESRHPQRMWIMNVVWPVVALFGTVLTIWAYLRYGRLVVKEAAGNAKSGNSEPPGTTETPFPVMVGKATLHCGSGCTLGRYRRRVAGPGLPRRSPCGSGGTSSSTKRCSPSGCSTTSSRS